MLLRIITVFRLQGHYSRDYRERRDVRWTSAEGSVPTYDIVMEISRRMSKYQAHSVTHSLGHSLFAIQ